MNNSPIQNKLKAKVHSSHSTVGSRPIIYKGIVWFPVRKEISEMPIDGSFRKLTDRHTTYTVMSKGTAWVVAHNASGHMFRFTASYPVNYLSPTM